MPKTSLRDTIHGLTLLETHTRILGKSVDINPFLSPTYSFYAIFTQVVHAQVANNGHGSSFLMWNCDSPQSDACSCRIRHFLP